MPMKSRLFLFNTACLFLSLFLSGCHSSREVAYNKTSRQPKFIDDVYMNRHKKGNSTVPGSNHREKAADREADAGSTNENKTDNNTPQLSRGEERSIRKKYSDIMNVKSKDITNYSLYEFIDAWYGVNYHLGGSDHSGIDCSAFAKKLYGEVYGMDLDRTAAEQYSKCKRIKQSSEANEGDLVFFHVHSRHITHVGVYLMNDYFVHASSSQGVVISNLNDDYWHKYYAGIGRVKK